MLAVALCSAYLTLLASPPLARWSIAAFAFAAIGMAMLAS